MIVINAIKTFIFGLILAVIAWLTVHLVSIFGVFIAVGFAIHWLLYSEKRFCFLCKLNKNGKCYFCNGGHNFISMILDIFIILVVTGLSFGVVFGEFAILRYFGFPDTPKTVSFVIPDRGQYRIGEIIPMRLELSGIKTSVNSVQADIGFNPDNLEVIDISTNDSFANVFIQKEIDNNGGWARLTGGLPNPGFVGDHGLFATIYFQAKTAGLAQIKFLNSSLVLANDGRGRNVLKDYPIANYLIIPEKVGSDLKIEQQKLIKAESGGDASASVLGVEQEKGLPSDVQLRLYDGSAPSTNNVLGTETQDKADQKSENSLIHTFFLILEKIDASIVSYWKFVLHIN